ncbi:hypothetical protein EXIGLDRAFT_610534, partial [Exidia glandulosa HHB12029]
QLQECADKYKLCYVFEVANMRNSHLKDVRQRWKDTGRIFFGRNTVIAKALGSTEADEHKPGLHKLAKHLNGPVGVFFTDHDAGETEAWFAHYEQLDFARAGNKATKDVTIDAGPIMQHSSDPPEPFQHTMEPQLRKLGLSTRLERGVPTLDQPHVVCRKGDVLTAEQAQILKLIGERLATFRARLLARWSAESTAVVQLADATQQGEPEIDDVAEMQD